MLRARSSSRRSAAGVLAAPALLAALLLQAAASPNPRYVDVEMKTALGAIVIRLDAAHAPRTTANFLRYVDARKYDGIVFYRIVRPGNQSPHRPIQVIQGGLDLPDAAPYPFGRIPLESTARTGLHFDDGEIGIARDKDPGTGGSEFFICIGATNRLLDADRSPDRYGYAAFGRVVRGMDVVRRIQHAPARAQRLAPPIRILETRRIPE
jgi:peptidyl-prolyl cis-trans isomerase A (cyclophilin A)